MVRKFAVISVMILIVLLVASISLFPAVAAGTACPGAPAPRLSIGGTARPAQVYSTLWKAPNSTAVLTVISRASGDTFTVRSEPQCAHGPYNWYQVLYKGVVGWVTEGTGSTYWVEPVGGVVPTVTTTPATPIPSASATPTKPVGTPVPPTPTKLPTTPAPNTGACPGAPAPRLKVGGNARPAQVFSSLRSAKDSNIVLSVMYRANNDVFKVVAGPYCGHGPHNWWQVQYKNTTGWVTEGQGSTYWVEPTT
jgi:hypothetical protein